MIEDIRGPNGLALGHRTIDTIGDHSLAVSPQNYEVWLTYLAGWSPDLKSALDAALNAGETLTDERIEEFYEEYFSTSKISSQVMETGNRIAQEIADALGALKSAGATTEMYGAALDRATHSLESESIDPNGLQRIVSALSAATKEMSKQNQVLSGQLKLSSREMERLRSSLQKARAEALTDGLTGIANRKLFDETLRLRKSEADKEKYDLCLVICDIDHFKSFNDTWGHQTGDQVIRFVAGALSKFALPDHLVARYGGEEFAIIMPRTMLSQAMEVSEQIRKAIEAKKLMRRSTNQPLGAITVSFGVAQYKLGETGQQLIGRADKCLYQSKNDGRNQVTSEQALRDVADEDAA